MTQVGHWKANVYEAAELVATLYDRIEVRGLEFVRVYLTPSAMANGLAFALPEQASRLERPRRVMGTGTPTLVRIPIVGRKEWLEAAMRSA